MSGICSYKIPNLIAGLLSAYTVYFCLQEFDALLIVSAKVSVVLVIIKISMMEVAKDGINKQLWTR